MSAAVRLDTVFQVATPEGCEIDLRAAGPVARARAWLLDFFLRFVAWIFLVMIFAGIGDFGFGVILLSVFLLDWFYPILFEVYRNGQTPGKKACGLAVVHDDGRPVTWSASFIRNTLRAIDFLPFCYALGFVATLWSAQGKRLGDLAAGTLVVYLDRAVDRRAWEKDASGSEAPPFPLNREEQTAIIEFCRRAAQLTPERAAELASVASPLTAGLSGESAQQRLRRIGNFLLGGHASITPP